MQSSVFTTGSVAIHLCEFVPDAQWGCLAALERGASPAWRQVRHALLLDLLHGCHLQCCRLRRPEGHRNPLQQCVCQCGSDPNVFFSIRHGGAVARFKVQGPSCMLAACKFRQPFWRSDPASALGCKKNEFRQRAAFVTTALYLRWIACIKGETLLASLHETHSSDLPCFHTCAVHQWFDRDDVAVSRVFSLPAHKHPTTFFQVVRDVVDADSAHAIVLAGGEGWLAVYWIDCMSQRAETIFSSAKWIWDLTPSSAYLLQVGRETRLLVVGSDKGLVGIRLCVKRGYPKPKGEVGRLRARDGRSVCGDFVAIASTMQGAIDASIGTEDVDALMGHVFFAITSSGHVHRGSFVAGSGIVVELLATRPSISGNTKHCSCQCPA
eukprot:TRINITY_DN31301_c0_g1_i1.p1 TRINITY_DN31301_c0_g1~~TRINITY_DN31301_c0_g1_i1.p1  ORF type:complete len:381 (-),score=34.12 TRINITY_DN31301_c0_g1_i1:118-1260(-)